MKKIRPKAKRRAKQLNRNTKGLVPFPKGVSGNPGGRPKYSAISEAMRYLLTLPFADLKTFVPQTNAEKIALVQVLQAQKTTGRASAAWVADRVEGMPVATVRSEVSVLKDSSVVIDILKPPEIDVTPEPPKLESDS